MGEVVELGKGVTNLKVGEDPRSAAGHARRSLPGGAAVGWAGRSCDDRGMHVPVA